MCRPWAGLGRGGGSGPGGGLATAVAGGSFGATKQIGLFRARLSGPRYFPPLGAPMCPSFNRPPGRPRRPGAFCGLLCRHTFFLPIRLGCRLRRRAGIGDPDQKNACTFRALPRGGVGSRESMPKSSKIEHFGPCRQTPIPREDQNPTNLIFPDLGTKGCALNSHRTHTGATGPRPDLQNSTVPIVMCCSVL